MTTSGADDMPPFNHIAVLKAGMVDGVSWMTLAHQSLSYGELHYRPGNRATPLMINNSESQNYLINIKAVNRRAGFPRWTRRGGEGLGAGGVGSDHLLSIGNGMRVVWRLPIRL
jgi:hypothetical protein